MTTPNTDRSLEKDPSAVDDSSHVEADGTCIETIDARSERKLLLKLDLYFVPIIMLVYLTCFLDRSNIGNVKVAGMPEDIGASPKQFSTAVSIFYATYVAFEPPWSVMMKWLTPRILLTSLCVVWSLCTVLTGFIHNVAGLYAVRLVLGACEAGLFPALNLYLTMVYKRQEQAIRVSYLFVCTAIAGAFGGLLAYCLLKMDGVAGLAGWRWVYIIEGIFSILVAPLIWFGLPNDPSKAYFLTDEEKRIMKVRAIQRAQYMGSEDFSWEEIRIGLKDPKLYMSGAIQFCQDILLYGFSTFLPSIIVSMGYSVIQAQYLSIPVYIFGGLAFLAAAFISDRYCIRGPLLWLTNVPGIVGYVLIICSSSNGVKFLGTFLCAVSVYNGPGLNLTWLNVNVAPHYRRATAIGMQLSIGNSAGVVAGQIYRTAPYRLGNIFSVAALGLSQVLIVVKWLYLRQQNREKERYLTGEEDGRRVRTGDRAPDFKYHL
ncbi:putative transporter [Beauveria bassiana D1-5]|uniref:Major facilitator superfamily transporter n=2 Tax=Beauveria bassiana TaxID=176275 RepID=J4WI34_BEAB2|nr:major facilitator superfamily transporter [Beauveria bassiana ARSEF 2860]EJP69515.1 major facilitator superfamily transporter [Beauveria bassiana ARSEF 2860]KAF1737322.1 putative transporter [Beauveria bassiana]KAH8718326.1 putative transporter [Beauveria bassiana]KGQ10822.1 putative transporter [Beauveria bassiana D1-5]